MKTLRYIKGVQCELSALVIALSRQATSSHVVDKSKPTLDSGVVESLFLHACIYSTSCKNYVRKGLRTNGSKWEFCEVF